MLHDSEIRIDGLMTLNVLLLDCATDIAARAQTSRGALIESRD